MIFRLFFLVFVTFLGALIYCSRSEQRVSALFTVAAKKTVNVSLWVILPYLLMVLIETIWIDA